MNRRSRAIACVVLAIIPATMLAGCANYQFGSAHAQEVRTVAVPVFENTSLEPGLERLLTEAVIRRIQRTTPYRVTSPDAADTVLIGEITEVRRRSLSRRQGTGLTEELAYELVMDLSWVDARTGRARVDVSNLRAAATVSPSIPVGEPTEFAQLQAYDQMAERIVDRLLNDW